jgi:ferredoxin
MTHIITSLCLRDAGCVEVCPVEVLSPEAPGMALVLYRSGHLHRLRRLHPRMPLRGNLPRR